MAGDFVLEHGIGDIGGDNIMTGALVEWIRLVKFELMKTFLFKNGKEAEQKLIFILIFYQIIFLLSLSLIKSSLASQVVFAGIALNSHIYLKFAKFIFDNNYGKNILLNPKICYQDFSINIKRTLKNNIILKYSIFTIDFLFILVLIVNPDSFLMFILFFAALLWHSLPFVYAEYYLKPIREITSDYFRNHRSEIIIYMSGSPNFEYQLKPWINILENLEYKKTIVIRERHFIEYCVSLPIACLLISDVQSLFNFFGGTEKIVFYVNNSVKNFQMLSLRKTTHILLYHGESDKNVMANNASKAYDYIFVAGQAAVERYKSAGVDINPERFIIIGRPQLDALFKKIKNGIENDRKTVLYAPTFEGFRAEDSYSSLEKLGPKLVRDVLESKKYRLIVKVHPLTMSRSALYYDIANSIRKMILNSKPELGIWVDPVKSELDLYDLFVQSDVLIGDVSNVPIDYLAINRPIIATNPFGINTSAGEKLFPFWKGANILSEKTSILDLIRVSLEEDPKRDEREKLAKYYFGDDIYNCESMTNKFLYTVGNLMDGVKDKSLSP